ncbi:MAG TPA: YicC family protein [Thermoclostridium caenicola]|uniref:TIGR00255 family protein n=1 Tax=Thermoclostridium caenicola TaxID=659425 RepID=A0A1M6B9E9_9FIRM|nr:YicC/YloC family endoribonuclease [Thermoclostridium caenicola]SHI45287.1 TIGR00255 family protein [Thermoclostridium caenicola]HOK43981.1 YicC family protein [Thermoclostridium caenicola]HOL83918.1 YicC family protein [Thermoclostridium caenicola]HOP71886.1 YicC family protein [Thermoclostridium caenicola]HPO76326.1 YicC family protein [Thermoclostridium caenicola]
MLRSMTGFGCYEYSEDDITFTIEIKTVNHRYFDLFLRMPKQIQAFEDRVRSIVSNKIQRGKVDVYITCDNKAEDAIDVVLDERLARAYSDALKAMADHLGIKDDISVSTLARFPDILKVEKKEDDERIGNILEKAVDQAVSSLVEMREKEGEKLKESMVLNLQNVRAYLDKVRERAPLVVREYKEKLEARIEELAGMKVDPARLAMEVALFADKCSIDEEIVRLESHIDQMNDLLEKGSPVGKKLDFLIQEMNREVNTIGAKASDLDITRCVVELKSEIEKLREQVQNIE